MKQRALPGNINRWIALALILSLFAISCSTVAVTGRRQFNFIPDAEIMSMSFAQYDAFLTENSRSEDAQGRATVQRVGIRIKDAVERYFLQQGMADELDGYAWEFNLVASDQVNAWCMPGGKVVFYDGIMPVCGDETGIAVVMGHEVAHAVARHGAERMSQGLVAQMGGVALSKALENNSDKTQQIWLSAFGLGAQFGALLPFGRKQESEADHLGLIFMAMAGYDPNSAVSFWQRMAEAKGGAAPPEFMSTHPSDETRIRQIRERLPEAMKYYRP